MASKVKTAKQSKEDEDEGLQILERVEISDDEEDFAYEEVDEGLDDDEDDDDLADALASIHMKQRNTQAPGEKSFSNTMTQVRPSVVDDFTRNFLIKAGMKKTLDIFNAEWYELQSKGKLPPEISSAVPDIYLRNEELDHQARVLREEVDKMREVSTKAQATWDKFRKERDYHRMHHKRVVQEKNKLITDLKRLRNHLKSYEPTIEELQKRHEAAIKEKMLIRLERDRLKARVKVLEEQVASLLQPPEDISKPKNTTKGPKKQATFPVDGSIPNPFADLEFDAVPIDMFQVRKTFKGHLNSVSCVAFHPKKPIFATASDDETWRLWTLPDCELVMSGEGHTSWLSGLHFHPHGSHLVSSSGDGTVKIWEFAQAKCTHTFTDHTQAVWGCEFHFAGDFIASCSMDHTLRIWDLVAGKCRQTLRGHVDSVNALAWIPYTSNLCSASGDKTVSVWDARSGLCVQTLYGHSNSCNDVIVSQKGDVIVSSDADGTLKAWDIRMVAELGTIEAGQHPLNKIAIDRSGTRVVAASDDGTIKVTNLIDFSIITEMPGHDDAVQCVGLSPNDGHLISGSSDCTFRIWA